MRGRINKRASLVLIMRMKTCGLTALHFKLLVLLAVLSVAPVSHAATYILTNYNSTASIDTASQSGFYDWTVDGLNYLRQEQFWYRVGSTGPEHSIDTLTFVSAVASDTDLDFLNDKLVVNYSSAASSFTLQATYQLFGTAFPSSNSDVKESIKIINTASSGSLDIHLFDYGHIVLNGPGNDNIYMVGSSTVIQTNAADKAWFNVVATQTPSHHQLDNVFPTMFNSLTDGSATTLNDSNGPLVGNVTWAFEWDMSILHGASAPTPIQLDNLMYVPEPSTFALASAGLFLVGLAFKRAKGGSRQFRSPF